MGMVNGTQSALEENIPAAVNCSRQNSQKMIKNPQKCLKLGFLHSKLGSNNPKKCLKKCSQKCLKQMLNS
jgi:predicted Zn-ribbon and HTH transcriptional regulator